MKLKKDGKKTMLKTLLFPSLERGGPTLIAGYYFFFLLFGSSRKVPELMSSYKRSVAEPAIF